MFVNIHPTFFLYTPSNMIIPLSTFFFPWVWGADISSWVDYQPGMDRFTFFFSFANWEITMLLGKSSCLSSINSIYSHLIIIYLFIYHYV